MTSQKVSVRVKTLLMLQTSTLKAFSSASFEVNRGHAFFFFCKLSQNEGAGERERQSA